jgi:osmotically-inducible protein OsmY
MDAMAVPGEWRTDARSVGRRRADALMSSAEMSAHAAEKSACRRRQEATRAAPDAGSGLAVFDGMTTKTLTDADIRVREEVRGQLDWDPDVDNSAIGVVAKNRVVTLTGFIDSYAGKLAAERAAKRVRGVRAVANDIKVRLKLACTDADIARDAARALELRIGVPESVQAVVHDGYVTLTGKVSWIAQRRNAEKAVTHIRGVRGVFNHIEITPVRTNKDVRRRIVEALHRQADVNARHISVGVEGDTVVLTGTVSAWTERDAAEHAAAGAPGIRSVDNRIVVEPAEHDDVDEIC